MKIGDVVTTSDGTKWALDAMIDAAGPVWSMIRPGRDRTSFEQHVAPESELVLVSSPVIAVGTKLIVGARGERMTVLEVREADVVMEVSRSAPAGRRPDPASPQIRNTIRWTAPTVVSKASLVADNFAALAA